MSLRRGVAGRWEQQLDVVPVLADLLGNLDHPLGPLLYSISTMHCMTVSLAQGGEGLGTMWGRELARELLAEAGFTQVELHELRHDFQNDYYVVRP